jgi:hypothetical protein
MESDHESGHIGIVDPMIQSVELPSSLQKLL